MHFLRGSLAAEMQKVRRSQPAHRERLLKCYQLLRIGIADFSLFKWKFERRHWRWSRLKRRYQRWKGPAVLLLVLAIIVWLMSGGAQIFGTE